MPARCGWSCCRRDSGNSGALGSHLAASRRPLHRMGIATVLASRYPLSVASSLRLTQQLYDSLCMTSVPSSRRLSKCESSLFRLRRGSTGRRFSCTRGPKTATTTDRFCFGLIWDLRPFAWGRAAFCSGATKSAGRHGRSWPAFRRGSASFLVVTGASGTGKSSVVLGGLCPTWCSRRRTRQQSALQNSR